jgi:hypothetical protein
MLNFLFLPEAQCLFIYLPDLFLFQKCLISLQLIFNNLYLQIILFVYNFIITDFKNLLKNSIRSCMSDIN